MNNHQIEVPPKQSYFLKYTDEDFHPFRDFYTGRIIFYDNKAKAKLERMAMSNPEKWEVCGLDLEYDE